MPVRCHAFPVPAFRDNYIWLIPLAGDSFTAGMPMPPPGTAVAVVDPGDAEPVLRAVADLALTPAAVLTTHHHGDHVGGVTALRRRYDIPVYGPAGEAIPDLSRPLHEGDRIDLGDGPMTFSILAVPGHTAGHIAYYGHSALFCGDTLFAGGCGRLFEGTPAQMHRSLTKIAALPDATEVYCAHEYTLSNLTFALQVEPQNADLHRRLEQTRTRRSKGEPTVPAPLGIEKKTNPFLRCHVPSVIAAAERVAGRRLNPGEETFAVIRRWKDTAN